MKNENRIKDKIVDVLLIMMMILPLAACIVLKVLTAVPPEGIDVTGAQIYWEIKMPIMPLYITEATVVSAAVVITILAIVLYLTRGLKAKPDRKRQHIAEFIVQLTDNFVAGNMGERFMGFSPFVAGIMGLSALSSLSSLLGLFPPTSDVNIVGGWAILVFIIITHYKLKGGIGNYLKGFTEPVVFFTPMNIVSELATPVAMAFRHYGNVLSGVVISTLLAAAFGGLSNLVLGWLPGFIGQIPLFRVGIPAVLSLYFDLFSGCLQAFIFAILTMLYVSNGFPEEAYEARMKKKQKKLEKSKAKGI